MMTVVGAGNLFHGFEKKPVGKPPVIEQPITGQVDMVIPKYETTDKIKRDLQRHNAGRVFDDKYQPKPYIQEVARRILPLTLADIIAYEVVRPTSDLYAFYAGIQDGQKQMVSFQEALKTMWKAKAERSDCRQEAKEYGTWAVRNFPAEHTRVTLPDFKRDYLRRNLDDINGQVNWDDAINSKFGSRNLSEETRADLIRFMTIVTKNIDENVLMGYAIKELMPNGGNEIYNVHFFDQLLQTAGLEYVASIPALGDGYLSYGPYQFTTIAVEPTAAMFKRFNPLLSTPVPTKMKDFGYDMNNHTRAAILFAYNNWYQLAVELSEHNETKKKKDKSPRRTLLEKFNDNFARLDDDSQRMFVTGVTGALHHAPAHAIDTIANFSDKGNWTKPEISIKNSWVVDRLHPYYDQTVRSAEAVRQYDALMAQYGKH